MTGHIHADSMRLYAEDAATHEKPWELWECKYNAAGWSECTGHPVQGMEFSYQRKPRTININGFEVPEPVKKHLSDGETYYVVNLASVDSFIARYTWSSDGIDKKFLSLGLIHTTKEAAETHAKALLSFTQNNGESDE